MSEQATEKEPTPEAVAKAALAKKRAAAAATAKDVPTIHAKLLTIQTRLRVTKDRGKGHNPSAQVTYEYRNAEDILEAVKPLCAETNTVVTVDVVPKLLGESIPAEIREVKAASKDRYGNTIAATFALISGPRFAAVATATITDCETGASISASAFAFIDAWRKGQTEPEKLCGSADSYASKYALGHLFALDNNRDADMESDEPKTKPAAQTASKQPAAQPAAEPAPDWAF